MLRLANHLEGIAGLHFAFFDHLGDPAAVADNQLWQIRVPLLQLVTWDSDVGDLDQARVADAQPVEFGQILAIIN